MRLMIYFIDIQVEEANQQRKKNGSLIYHLHRKTNKIIMQTFIFNATKNTAYIGPIYHQVQNFFLSVVSFYMCFRLFDFDLIVFNCRPLPFATFFNLRISPVSLFLGVCVCVCLVCVRVWLFLKYK